MCVYKIAKWNDVFENAHSRKLVKLNWVSMPVGFSSNGYQSMLDEFGDKAPAIYGAWCALVAFAAGCPKRGTIATSKGEPIKVAHIARQVGFPSKLLEELIAWASRPDVHWLEHEEDSAVASEEPAEETIVAPALEEPAKALEESSNDPPLISQPSPKVFQAQGEEGNNKTRHNNTLSLARSDKPKSNHLDDPQFAAVWDKWGRHLLELNKTLTPTASQAQLYELASFSTSEAIEIVQFSISRGARNLLTNGDHKLSGSARASPAGGRGAGGFQRRRTPVREHGILKAKSP